MRLAALVLTVCGCNQIFDLQPTQLVDASPDVAADARRMCPPIGTPLRFGAEFHQVVRQDCQGYNVSAAANVGVASCQETMPTYGTFAYEGTRDQLMTKVDVALTYIDSVRIYPEGDHVAVRGYDATLGYVANLYVRDQNGWTLTKDSLPPITSGIVSAFSTGPDRRIVTAGYGLPITEYVQDDTGAWSEAATYAIEDWQCSNVNGVALTSDGLRLIVSCNRSDNYRLETRYAERTTRSETFGPLMTLEGAPTNLSFVMLDDDCSRAYFSALNAVFTADVFF
jgi:hypothetical protein